MSEGWQRDLYVKASPIHGLGVFARRTYATGEVILLREERPVTPQQPLDEAAGEFEYHCDWLDGGRQVYLGFPERHVNHSCDANAFLRRGPEGAQMVALRPIRPGDEVTNNYSVDLWDGEPWRCCCGSRRCLGTVPGDFFSLPLERKIELEPFLSEWFLREHAEEYAAFVREAGLE